ncbi:MAG: hypothetical protein Kapaf2KO_11880 [Candidatus Kapaibacteriales bacterium]
MKQKTNLQEFSSKALKADTYIKFFFPFALCVLILFAVSCANNVAPGGGPGDAEPPEITEYYPANKTLNFGEDKVVILFDDYMNRQSVTQALYITPEVKTEFDWSGKELEINFAEELLENKTYAITLDAGYSDRFGNKPSESFTLIFSTGPDLDSASISGTINGKSENLYAALWKIDQIDPDTLDITQTKADYRLKIGTSGKFSFKGLDEGTYRIASLDDRFQDGRYDFGSDGFSAYTEDLELSDGELLRGISLFQGPIIDTAAPELISAFYRNKYAFSIRLSEPVMESSLIGKSSLVLLDSLGRKNNVEYILPDSTEKDIIVGYSDVLNPGTEYRIYIEDRFDIDNTGMMFVDSSGNYAWPYQDTISFYVPNEIEERDSILPLRLISSNVSNSGEKLNPKDGIQLKFDNPIDLESIINASTLTFLGTTKSSNDTIPVVDSNRVVQIQVLIDSPGTYKVIANLEPRSRYRFSFDKNLLKSLFGYKYEQVDSSKFEYTFSTSYIEEKSKLSGEIEISEECSGKMLIRLLKGEETSYEFNIDMRDYIGRYKFGPIMLLPGTYKIKAFCDANGNKKRDYGYPMPFQFAEQEYIVEKMVEIKPNWDVEDVLIEVGNLKIEETESKE